MKKRYLGDAVYVEVENGMFKLTTEDGLRATNTIFLEPEVYRSFVDFAEAAFAANRRSVAPAPSREGD